MTGLFSWQRSAQIGLAYLYLTLFTSFARGLPTTDSGLTGSRAVSDKEPWWSKYLTSNLPSLAGPPRGSNQAKIGLGYAPDSDSPRRVVVDLDPYPALGKPRNTFRPDDTFKITVFSDLHFGEGPEVDWGPEQDRNSTRLMKTVLREEQPDYVVLNGDLITGENTFRENSTTLIDQIVAPLNAAGVAFSSTHGNHDNDVNITHIEEIIQEQKLAPLSYTRTASSSIGGKRGPGNYWVPVYQSQLDPAPVLILWFFDSRGGIYPDGNAGTKPIPDWVDASVADWIQSESALMEAAWGPDTQRSAMAFMHIPPYAIKVVQAKLDSSKNPGQNADYLGRGSVQASMDPNSVGNDEPFWDAVSKIKNLRAVISGHDHGNEWCAREPTKDVVFCFDKHSGYGGYSDSGWGHGVRNIVFKTSRPDASIDTWIRLEDGDIRARVALEDVSE
ncbi:Metallo-dependent phosphatase [Coprinopsis marcescibilis]|uniref:Metallo-dependent phosphatase n=1 Tax=Coprinopsis marcescibilis TaxID=230819 RepID=A0A5C3LAQ8_COPMA|nr:Metallo-dependent phosphatase [Coprinopsis marcescibilis]